MMITILGNGGAVSDGLPYNAFMMNGNLLVECPPDIMNSLYRENFDITGISDIYISHLHGDHAFGFPFFILRLFYEATLKRLSPVVRLYIPSGGREYMFDLVAKALSPVHPCNSWIDDHVLFTDISSCDTIYPGGYTCRLSPMNHYQETYGFSLYRDSGCLLSYIPDTLWGPGVEKLLAGRPELVIADLNGEEDDPVPIHMTEREFITRGIPLLPRGTMVLGTHLKHMKVDSTQGVRYAFPGMTIQVGD